MAGHDRRIWIVAVVLTAAVPAVSPVLARPGHHRCRTCYPDIPAYPDVPDVEGPPAIIPYGRAPEGGEAYRRLPFGWDDRSGAPSRSQPVPYSQGFVLTYTVRHADEARTAGALNRYADVGKALAGCWSSSDATRKAWREVTLRVSFKRDGSVNGVPRIQHLDAPGDVEAHDDLQTDFLSTLNGCTPLHFSASLGSAIAGQIFAIRFIQAKDT